VVVEDVEPGAGLGVGQVELVAELVADAVGDAVAEDQRGDPDDDDELAVIVTPGAESREHERVPPCRGL
jgi:hypothetical protein